LPANIRMMDEQRICFDLQFTRGKVSLNVQQVIHPCPKNQTGLSKKYDFVGTGHRGAMHYKTRYNPDMQSTPHHVFKTGSGVDLAFAVIVLASYFATFSSIKTATTLEIALMISFGIAYIAIGVYGYKFVARSDALWLHLAYFALQIPLGSGIVYLSQGVGFNALILLPLAGHSVVLLPTLWNYAINFVVVVGYVIALGMAASDLRAVWSQLPTFLAGVIFIMVFTQMAVGEERARREVERLLHDLAEANERLRRYAGQVEELAITRERNRLAHEIHDGLGHYLTTIYMQLQAAAALMKTDAGRATGAVEKAQSLTQEALLDVRRSVSALHSLPEESLPLAESIRKMLDNCNASKIEPVMQIEGTPRTLSPHAHLTLYRAAQESINNTIKHARASKIDVLLDFRSADQVRLVVEDNGRGVETVSSGFGLLGLQERANLLNGSLVIQTGKDEGFRMEICIPG